MRQLITVLPDVGLAEFEGGADALLRRCGGRVEQRLEHARGEVFPGLSQVLAQSPGLQAWTCHEPPVAGVGGASTVLHLHAASTLSWRPDIARQLSLHFGGWALSLLADRQREQYASGACYGGADIEVTAWSAGKPVWQGGAPAGVQAVSEDGMRAALVAQWQALSGGAPADLVWSAQSRVVSLLVSGLDRPDAAVAPPAGLHRAIFLYADLERVRAALDAAPVPAGGWRVPPRLHGRVAPVTQTPFVLLDGDFDDAWFTAFAWQLDVPATAVEMDATGGRFTWCEVRDGRQVRAGVGSGALDLAGVWGGLMVMLGEPAALAR